MFETVLVPTDGSEHARKAVLLASDIANKYKARVVLLHVLSRGPIPEEILHMAKVEHIGSGRDDGAQHASETKFPASSIFGVRSESEAETERVLQFLADNILTGAKRTAEEHGVEAVSTVVADGDAAEQILHYAKKESANLIIMGSRGLSDLKGLLMGSVSHKVSQLSPCSCITVK